VAAIPHPKISVHGVHIHIKFRLDQYILSPIQGENHQKPNIYQLGSHSHPFPDQGQIWHQRVDQWYTVSAKFQFIIIYCDPFGPKKHKTMTEKL